MKPRFIVTLAESRSQNFWKLWQFCKWRALTPLHPRKRKYFRMVYCLKDDEVKKLWRFMYDLRHNIDQTHSLQPSRPN